jgi:hypothetical protein
MALRPVSELGLVEITDVPARDGDRNGTGRDRSRSARASTPGKPDAGRRASQRVAGAAQPSTAAKSRSVGTAATADDPGRARGRLIADDVSGAAPRTASTRTAKRSDRPSTRGRATPVRQTSAGSRANEDPASRATQRPQDRRELGKTQPRSAAQRRISLLTGAGLVAGGVLVVRALQR